jgi:hypothetical protein
MNYISLKENAFAYLATYSRRQYESEFLLHAELG